MSLTSPLTRAKARELARAQSPSRSALTEPLYTSPRKSLLQNTDDTANLSKQRTYSRSARKSKGNPKRSFSPEDKENISIEWSSKSGDEISSSNHERKGHKGYSHQRKQSQEKQSQKAEARSYSTVSSPAYFSESFSARVVEDNSPVMSISREPKISPRSFNSNEIETRSEVDSIAMSKDQMLHSSKVHVSKWFLILVFVVIFTCALITFSRRTGATLQSSTRHNTYDRNIFGWFQALLKPRKNDKDSFQTAFSFLITQMNDLAMSLEERNIHPDATVRFIQEIMEKTESILKEGLVPSEFRQWRESLYRQVFHFIHLHEFNDFSSNDSIARLLESKLRLYSNLIEQDYALSSEGAKVVCSTPSKFLQQSKYWLARIAFLLDPAINTISLHYPKGPETILSENVSLGNCWAFAGKTGTVTIQLSKTIQPVAFSLEHNIDSQSRNTPNAPKLFRVYLIQDKKSENGQRVEWLVGTYHYSIEKGGKQLFPVRVHQLPYASKIRLEIIDNYGGSYTCVYRFRVHGHEQNDSIHQT